MRVNYNFDNMLDIFESMRSKNKPSFSDMQHLKYELNKFFKDSKCIEILYTENTDKPFFGMKVFVAFNSSRVYEYLMDDENVVFSEYSIELDSRLFDPVMDLSARELTALLIHEIGHVVNDNTPITKARNYLAQYLTANKTTLKMTDSIHYKEILAFGLKDYISKCNSAIYNRNDIEVMADDFARSYGFGEDLENALKKISSSGFRIYEGGSNNIGVVFAWTLRLYCSIATRRVAAIRSLNSWKQLTASMLEKREYVDLVKKIEHIDDSVLLGESVSDAIKAKMRKNHMKTIKSMDDDFYEIAMQVRNVEDEDDALYLMRQINSRMSIMYDYLQELDLPEAEKKKCFEVYDKYDKARSELAKAQTYKRSTTAIYVNYPEIKDCRY